MKFSTSTTENLFHYLLAELFFFIKSHFQYILSYASLLHALLSIKTVRRHHYRVSAVKDLKVNLRALDAP